MPKLELAKHMRDLAARARSLVDKEPVWRPAFEWIDEDGLYASETQAWVYREMPTDVLRSVDAYEAFLAAIATALPGVETHLLAHTWMRAHRSPEGQPAELSAFQERAIDALVPAKGACIGLRLTASVPARKPVEKVMDAVNDAVDTVLAERAPDLTVYDASREQVTSALAAAGAQALSRDASGFIESWFTYGHPRDISATERDDVITFADGSRLEMVGSGPMKSASKPVQLDAGESSAASVISVRGTLSLIAQKRATPRGVLTRASVLYGRRAMRPTKPWHRVVRSLGTVQGRPLPLRQLAALSETMPCAEQRLDPSGYRIGGHELAALGFCDLESSSHSPGLLLGSGGQGMGAPVRLALNTLNAPFVIIGDEGSGRTVTCEVLAHQARLAGTRVLYISGASAPPLTSKTFTVSNNLEAVVPPLTHLPRDVGLAAMAELLAAADPAMAPDARQDINVALERALAVSQVGTPAQLLRLTNSSASADSAMRGVAQRPAFSALLQEGVATPLPVSALVDMSSWTFDPHAQAVAAAALVVVACSTDEQVLAIVDDVDFSSSPWAQGVLAQAAALPHVGVLVTGSDPATAALWPGTSRLLLASGAPDAGERVEGGGEALSEWFAQAGPVIEDGLVMLPAAGVLDVVGRVPFGVQIGPWPTDVLELVTAGEAAAYG